MEALTVPAPPRHSAGRVMLVVIGTIFTVAVIGIAAFLLLDSAARHSFRSAAAYANVRALVVRTSAGSVNLHQAPRGTALVVKADETEALARPKVRARMTGNGTLTLTASCPDNLECSVDYQLWVPRDIAVKVSAGFGQIRATGLASTSSIQLGTTAGSIHATGLSAPDVSLSTGLGSLTAALVQPPTTLTATTLAGDLHLTVPDTTYSVHAHSGVGHVSRPGLRADASSPRTIDATSSLGDITITPR